MVWKNAWLGRPLHLAVVNILLLSPLYLSLSECHTRIHGPGGGGPTACSLVYASIPVLRSCIILRSAAQPIFDSVRIEGYDESLCRRWNPRHFHVVCNTLSSTSLYIKSPVLSSDTYPAKMSWQGMYLSLRGLFTLAQKAGQDRSHTRSICR